MRARAFLALCAACLGAATPLAAQDVEPVAPPIEQVLEDGVLLPDALLRSSARTFPSILAAFEKEAAARSDQLAAQGAFDLMLDAKAYSRVTGFYSTIYVDTKATQPLEQMGAEVFASYRLSNGSFPIYENYFNTNEFGEIKIGGVLPLLRNSTIDSRRFARRDAQLAASQAQLDVLLVKLKVQAEALGAYWRWVAAGREVGVYEELLEIAQARAIGLNREFQEGAAPRIAVVENEQNVLRRKTLLAEAQRKFATASNSLGFYLRGSGGQMIFPDRRHLPGTDDLEGLPPVERLVDTQLSQAVANRPELADLALSIERAQAKIALRRNDLRPRLDASAEISRDFGPIGAGGSSFDSTDTVVGVTFSVPLQRRSAQGRLDRAEAELRALELDRQRVSDELTVELENIVTNLEAAMELSSLAEAELAQARQMVTAERRRLALGAGDFFLVNVREETAASAQISQIRAELNGRLSAANYDTAVMNLDALGLR